MIEIFGYALAGIHAVLLFHVLRLAFLRSRQRAAIPRGSSDLRRLQAWQAEHAWDLGPALIAGVCAVADLILVVFLLDSEQVLVLLGLLYVLIGYFLLAYATISLRAVAEEPRRPGTVQREVGELRHGVTTDLTGTWHLRGLEEGDPTFVNLVEQIVLEPHQKKLSVRVNHDQWTEESVAERSGFAAFSHEVAEFLIFLVHAEWFAPYVPHYEVVELELWRDRFDEDNRSVKYRFFRIVARKEQIRRARERGYDPFHLERMFEVHFQGGSEV
jgi:hypothetical protein